MNNRQKLPLGGLLSIERAILAELIGNHMSNDKMEGAIARICELKLQKIRRYIYNMVNLFLLDVFLLHGAIVIRTFLVAARRDYICICATIILSSTWQASQRGTDGKLQETKPLCWNFNECQNVKGTTDQVVECCRHWVTRPKLLLTLYFRDQKFWDQYWDFLRPILRLFPRDRYRYSLLNGKSLDTEKSRDETSHSGCQGQLNEYWNSRWWKKRTKPMQPIHYAFVNASKLRGRVKTHFEKNIQIQPLHWEFTSVHAGHLIGHYLHYLQPKFLRLRLFFEIKIFKTHINTLKIWEKSRYRETSWQDVTLWLSPLLDCCHHISLHRHCQSSANMFCSVA